MTDMPTTYETHATTTTSSGPGTIGPRMDYIRTIPGILKIVEMVLDVIVFICSVIPWWPPEGWIGFVSMSALLTTLIIFLLYLFGVIHRLPAWRVLLEFIYYCVFSVFYLIAAIVAASYAKYHSSIAACTFFAFAATAIYAVDTYFQFRAWRTGQAEMTTTQASTTTTTTATHVETKTTY